MNPLLLLVSVTGVAARWFCPSYTNLPPEGEKCFLFSERPEELKLDFVGAQKACQNYGGSLASITSKAEDDFVIEMVKKFIGPGNYRIGLIVSSNRWMDGSIVDFTKYPPGKDADTLFKYPTAFMSTNNFAGWSSQSVTWQGGFVCSTMFRPLPSSSCTFGGQAVTDYKTFGMNGCPYGFAGKPCCPMCPKGGEPLFVDNCPAATHSRNQLNYCCPKNV